MALPLGAVADAGGAARVSTGGGMALVMGQRTAPAPTGAAAGRVRSRGGPFIPCRTGEAFQQLQPACQGGVEHLDPKAHHGSQAFQPGSPGGLKRRVPGTEAIGRRKAGASNPGVEESPREERAVHKGPRGRRGESRARPRKSPPSSSYTLQKPPGPGDPGTRW